MSIRSETTINPVAFEAAIMGNQEVRTLLTDLDSYTCRAAHIIDFAHNHRSVFVQKYPLLSPREYVVSSIERLEATDFAVAHGIAHNFTIVCLPTERQSGDYDFRQADYSIPESVALRVGRIGEDEIIVANNGQLLVRQDALTTRLLTPVEVITHASQIEQAIKHPRLKKLATSVEQTRNAPWGDFKSYYAPCEQAISEAARTASNSPDVRLDKAFNDLHEKTQTLKQMMQALQRIAAGESWQAIPEVAAYGEPITAQEAAELLGQMTGEIGVAILESTDQWRNLLTKHGLETEADEVAGMKDKVIGAIAKSLK